MVILVFVVRVGAVVGLGIMVLSWVLPSGHDGGCLGRGNIFRGDGFDDYSGWCW